MSNALLTFKGINYKADIWLNGQQIAESKDVVGTFRYYDFDVSSTLHWQMSSVNVLALKITRPSKNNDFPYKNPDIDLAFTFVDWAPYPPDGNMGIWRDVILTIQDTPLLRYPVVNTYFTSDQHDEADLTIYVEMIGIGKGVSGTVWASIFNISNCSQKVDALQSGETKEITWDSTSCPGLKVKNPELWWPWQMGPQTMYSLVLEFVPDSGKDDISRTQVIKPVEYKFGIREVTSELDKTGTRRQFKVNGQNILIKGGGYSPDLLQRRSHQKYVAEFEYMKDMGMNTVRLEGKMENDDFYQLADEFGILVMVGWCCCDSWQQWPDWTNETKAIAQESLRSQVKMQRIHPSVFLWLEGSDRAPPYEDEKILFDAFNELHWDQPIIASAAKDSSNLTNNTGVKMNGPYWWVPPNYWLTAPLKNGEDQFGAANGFATEISPGAVPLSQQSLDKILPKQDQWPMGDKVIYHCGAAGGGYQTLDKFNPSLHNRYGNTSTMVEYQKNSYLSVYESHRAMFEAFNQNKYKNSTGIIQWMLNNPWPSMIWHTFDYFYEPTASYFAIKKANEPLHVQYNYHDQSIWVINAGAETYSYDVYVYATVFTIDGKLFYNLSTNATTVATDSSTQFGRMNVTFPDDNRVYIIDLSLMTPRNRIVNTYWVTSKMDVVNWTVPTKNFFTYYANLTDIQNLKPVELLGYITDCSYNKTTQKMNGKLTILIINDAPIALMVKLRLTYSILKDEDILPIILSDNYFTLTPTNARFDVTFEYRNVTPGDQQPFLYYDCYNCIVSQKKEEVVEELIEVRSFGLTTKVPNFVFVVLAFFIVSICIYGPQGKKQRDKRFEKKLLKKKFDQDLSD